MALRKAQAHAGRTPLAIRELAVDPADVDRECYPVWIRLSRPLTHWEARGLASLDGSLRPDGDAVVVPDARLDDVAHAYEEWSARLETAERVGEELEGEEQMADQRRADRRQADGSHLAERTDPFGMH